MELYERFFYRRSAADGDSHSVAILATWKVARKTDITGRAITCSVEDLSAACYTMAYNERRNASLSEEKLFYCEEVRSDSTAAAAAASASLATEWRRRRSCLQLDGQNSYWILPDIFNGHSLSRKEQSVSWRIAKETVVKTVDENYQALHQPEGNIL